MRRLLLGMLALLAFTTPVLAASEKPLVIIAGRTQVIPAGDTLNLTLNPVTTNITGSTQCVQANSSGVISGTGSACGSGAGSVTSVTCGTGLSGGVITTTGTCSLTAPVTVALGGTNTTSASGTALDNISGFASTGFLTRTGAGAYSFLSTTNGIAPANLAQIGANTVLGNATASTANIAAQSMPSCSAATSALTWTTSSGFGCNTIAPGTGTVTSVATSGGVTGGTITTTGTVSLIGAAPPSGRLTLVTGTPVMTSDQTAKSQVYYDCYQGNRVPYYDGSNDQVDTIASCEVSLTMATSSTGVTNNAGVFDVYWVHSGASRVCVVTNGSGGGWASDTGGSNTVRGSGYSAVHNTRGYWTNTGTLTHCYNGATDYGSVSADQGTYLGTLYTTAAGQTGMQFNPAGASGGPNAFMALYNAYNRVRFTCIAFESTSSWAYNTATARPVNNSTSNRVSFVDGLQQSNVVASYKVTNQPTTNSTGEAIVWPNFDSTSAVTGVLGRGGVSVAVTGQMKYDLISGNQSALLGFHYVQAMEYGATTGSVFLGGSQYMALTITLDM